MSTESTRTRHTGHGASAERVAAVTRSVQRMQDSLGEDHPLQALARSALLSPYHFHRIFGEVTAATPARFLAAIRMARAKSLLVTTDHSVTDICMEVGYSSLGTFTYQFTRLVGASPRGFRRVARMYAGRTMDSLLAGLHDVVPGPGHPQVHAVVDGPDRDGRRVVIGAFPSGIPQAVPMSCAITRIPGHAVLGDLPDDRYRILAMSYPPSMSVEDALVEDDGGRALVCDGPPRIRVARGRVGGGAELLRLEMRPRRIIDPPLVSATPLLLAAQSELGTPIASLTGGEAERRAGRVSGRAVPDQRGVRAPGGVRSEEPVRARLTTARSTTRPASA